MKLHDLRSTRTDKEFKLVGKRISTLARLFNAREGFARRHDILPARNLTQPLQGAGPARRHVVELDPMLDEYYGMVGWDKNGVPTPDRLRELELDTCLKK